MIYHFRLCTTLILIATLALCWQSKHFFTGVFFFPFTFFPVLIHLIAIADWPSRLAQVALSIGTVGFFLFFAFIYHDAFYGTRDPQGPIAFIFLGLVATPVMLVIWMVACGLEGFSHKRTLSG
ncbi:hypothetical protein LF1_54330 [Rubripirellula obstinata]|uniref:Uncharacterized protein n=1 Tax=Rubripirellula obstinata TaxID=406547 RepID=A0A5B1CD65_9BACT|nr:hypothetical protein LF1_54330 [Rubripirellula obstinata]